MKCYRMIDLQEYIKDENGQYITGEDGRLVTRIMTPEEAEATESWETNFTGTSIFSTLGGAKQAYRRKTGNQPILKQRILLREYDVTNGRTIDA